MSFHEKRLKGQYFTIYNPFESEGFQKWAERCDLKNQKVLEPFAGSNNLITMLEEMNLCNDYASYDIDPQNKRGGIKVKFRDTLKNFPIGFDVCVTNPPYLARNSAKRRDLDFPECHYDDLYKFALDKCLSNCKQVAAIIPASFLNSKLFRDRLSCYILLNGKMFNDTAHPVCLALFDEKSENVEIYQGSEYLGNLKEFEKYLPASSNKNEISFNEKNGNIGLYAIDNTITSSIKFCRGSEIESDRICVSSRSVTRIQVEAGDSDKLIRKLNNIFGDFREQTKDLFLTPFKGLRQDNQYRRRLDFSLARDLINVSV
jgi:hypothetical protein